MSSTYTQSIQSLMNELARLPGIGMRSAEQAEGVLGAMDYRLSMDEVAEKSPKSL